MSKLVRTLALCFTIAGVIGGARVANAVSIDYSSTVGSDIVFDGLGNFSFVPAVNVFNVKGGSAAGDLGDITGTYAIGAITTVAGVSSAPVSGTGTFVVHDGSGFDLTGTLTWVNIVQVGTGDTLNTIGNVNLTGVAYGGVDPDLQALAAAGNAVNVLTFQFATAISLSTLKASPAQTTFSGSITSVPDGGMTVILLGAVFAGCALLRTKRFA